MSWKVLWEALQPGKLEEYNHQSRLMIEIENDDLWQFG